MNEVYEQISEQEWYDLRNRFEDRGLGNTAAAAFETVDYAMYMYHHLWSSSNGGVNPIKAMNPFYNFNNLIGTLLIDVPKISKDILRSATETISFFRPNLGITFVDDKAGTVEREIESMLPNFYEKVGSYNDQLDNTIRCNVYKSNRGWK
jgi:hypothetical protein